MHIQPCHYCCLISLRRQRIYVTDTSQCYQPWALKQQWWATVIRPVITHQHSDLHKRSPGSMPFGPLQTLGEAQQKWLKLHGERGLSSFLWRIWAPCKAEGTHAFQYLWFSEFASLSQWECVPWLKDIGNTTKIKLFSFPEREKQKSIHLKDNLYHHNPVIKINIGNVFWIIILNSFDFYERLYQSTFLFFYMFSQF